MAPAATIRAEGVEWTLDAFLDAHRFVRTGGDVPEIVRSAHAPAFRLDVVTASGELRQAVYAADVSWGDVLAVAPIWIANDLIVCDCGALAGLDRFNGRDETGQLVTFSRVDCPCCDDDDDLDGDAC